VEKPVEALLRMPDIFFVDHQACHDHTAAGGAGTGLVNETDVQLRRLRSFRARSCPAELCYQTWVDLFGCGRSPAGIPNHS